MKKCIHCRELIDRKANVCNHCHQNQIPEWFKLLAFLLIFGSFVYAAIVIINMPNNFEDEIVEDEEILVYPDSSNVIVTLEKYRKITTGMSLEEVQNVLGGSCTVITETEIMENNSITLGCNGNSPGSNVLLMFDNNKLISKTQLGLK